MRGAAAAAGRSAAAVEDGQLDPARRRDPRQLLLGAVDLPLRGEVAAVLAGVRVADHHLERAARAAVEDLLDERPGGAQVGDRLEQRHALQLRARLPGELPRRRARRRPYGSSRRSGGRRRCRAVPGLRRARPRRACAGAARRARGWPRRGRGCRASRDGGRTCGRGRGGRRGGRRRPARPGGRGGGRRGRRGRRAERAPSAYPSRAEPLPDLDEDGAEGLVVAARSGTTPITVVDIPHAAPSARQLGSGTARGRGRAPARARPRSSPAPTFGLPSRSPPIQVPNRSASLRRSSRSPSARSSSGIAFQKLCSKNQSPCRISSTTRGRLERISSVCQSSVISSASASSTRLALRRRGAVVVEAGEKRRDPAVGLEDRAAGRLGRMRRQDELDPQAGCRPPASALVVDAAALELGERVGERLARDPALGLVLAAAADPVVLLGDVDELEEERERAQDGGLALEPERCDRLAERDRASRRARASRASARMRSSSSSSSWPSLLDEHPPEQVAEQADVGAERGVGGHAPSLERTCRAAGRAPREWSPERPRARIRIRLRSCLDGASGLEPADLLAASQTLSQLSYGPATASHCRDSGAGVAGRASPGRRPRPARSPPTGGSRLRRSRRPRASGRRSRDPRAGSTRASPP